MAPQDAYNRALDEVDVLVMPTVARPPPNFGHGQQNDSPIRDNDYLPGVTYNTAPFDSKFCCAHAALDRHVQNEASFTHMRSTWNTGTGHPALSLPCGFVPAVDNPSIQLPTGIMLVGRMYDDVTVLKMAAAWEKAFDWKKM